MRKKTYKVKEKADEQAKRRRLYVKLDEYGHKNNYWVNNPDLLISLYRDRGLSGQELAIVLYVFSKYDSDPTHSPVKISADDLAIELNAHPNGIQRSLKELVKWGILLKRVGNGKCANSYTPNIDGLRGIVLQLANGEKPNYSQLVTHSSVPHLHTPVCNKPI